MKHLLTALVLTTAIAAPAAVAARPVTFTAILKNYGGQGAYLAIYITDKSGAYESTIWISGGKSKYYKHLAGWRRATRGSLREVRGITGASIGSGRKLQLTFDLADSLFDAGYELRVDAAVEDRRDSPADVVVALTRANAGKAVRGKRYIKNFSFK